MGMVIITIITYGHYHYFHNDDDDSDGGDNTHDEGKDEVEDAAATFATICTSPATQADAVTIIFPADVIDVVAGIAPFENDLTCCICKVKYRSCDTFNMKHENLPVVKAAYNPKEAGYLWSDVDKSAIQKLEKRMKVDEQFKLTPLISMFYRSINLIL